PRGGEAPVLIQATGSPGAQYKACDRERDSRGERRGRGPGKPGKQDSQQKSGGHAQTRYGVGVRLGKHDHRTGQRRAIRRASKTSSGEIRRMLSSIVERRLYVVTADGL